MVNGALKSIWKLKLLADGNKEFFCQPYEVVFRGLADLLKLVGEKYYPVRGKKLDNIITNLRDNILSTNSMESNILKILVKH